MNIKTRIRQHVIENRWQYILVVSVFVIGVFIGNFKVLSLEGEVKSSLLSLIDEYLRTGTEGTLDGQSIFISAFLNQAKTILALWFLGLTVIGLPLIIAVVFLRGFSLGFTIGFLLREKAGAGVVITLLSVFPQNMVYIPFLIIWAVLALNFSLYIVRGRNPNLAPLGRGIVGYSILMVLCLVIFIIGAFIEAYLSPWFLSLFL